MLFRYHWSVVRGFPPKDLHWNLWKVPTSTGLMFAAPIMTGFSGGSKLIINKNSKYHYLNFFEKPKKLDLQMTLILCVAKILSRNFEFWTWQVKVFTLELWLTMGIVKVDVTIHPYLPSLLTSVVDFWTKFSSNNQISFAGGLLELVIQFSVTFWFNDTWEGPFIKTFEGKS